MSVSLLYGLEPYQMPYSYKCASVHMGLYSMHILSRSMHTYTYISYIVIHLIEKKEKWGIGRMTFGVIWVSAYPAEFI